MDIKPKRRKLLKGTFVRSTFVASAVAVLYLWRIISPQPAQVSASIDPMKAEKAPEETSIEFSKNTQSEKIQKMAENQTNPEINVLGSSDQRNQEVTYTMSRAPRDKRVVRLEEYLTAKGSPLANLSQTIVDLSDKYGVDYRLAVAISMLESGGCKVTHKPHNCWGYMTGATWTSYEDGLVKYMEAMNKGYFAKGATTPESIGGRYAADPNWAARVRAEMSKIE